jgi:histidyl-tRNA synthetase
MAKPDVNPPRGMRDLLPALKESREAVLAVIRRQFSLYGYQEIETPALEELSRLLSSDSGENEKLIFRVLKRNLDENPDPAHLADLGLRFDLTVPLARFYATNRAVLPEVFRSIQIGPVWRAERPQKGRFRQFTQCDLDVIGEPGILAEIELITATFQTLQALGIAGAVVRLNDRRLLHAMLDTCGFAAADHGRALIIIDKIDKIGLDGVRRELAGCNYSTPSIDALLNALQQPEAILHDGNYAGLHAIAAAVTDICGPGSIRLDTTLVRGMGYYTGPIFEIEHPGSGVSIAGGGRYDGMIGRFLGEHVSACGFSIGFERVVELVRLQNASAPAKLALIYDESIAPQPLVKLQHALTGQGYSVRLVRSAKRLAKLLDSLKAEGFSHFALAHPTTPTPAELEIRELS